MNRILAAAVAACAAFCSTANTRSQTPVTTSGPIAQAAADPLAALPLGPDYDLTARTCTACHALETLTTKQPDQRWADVVASMGERGASASPEELARIAVYLEANLGKSKP